MHETNQAADYDVAVIGGGPAGLSGAVVLGRTCRRVIVFDHGRPRNYAARALHGFLGSDGITPTQLLERGRRDARSYDIEIEESEVKSINRFVADNRNGSSPRFRIAS